MSAVKNVIKDNYNMMLLRDFLRERIKDAGFSHAEISKTPTGTRVALHVTRPGIVIGRKGVGIRELTEKLNTEFGLKNPQISVIEIPKPELSPNVMCNRMASHIERGTAFRRATMWTMQQIMDSGAMGVQITISGKLRGDRSAFEKHTAGILPRAGHHADVIVDEDIAHVRTPMGLIGIRIRIAIKEKVIPEFELKKDESKEETSKQVSDEKAGKIKEETSKQVSDEKAGKIKEETSKQVSDEKAGKIKEETAEEKKPKSESEQIIIEEEKMKDLVTLEEEEEKMK
ncbi:MAG: 30S ribosomal protein S3 [Thaumarchaeota archaeon]|nr:30S ribosomal protein S3 [Nitrososphaerota archaeon]